MSIARADGVLYVKGALELLLPAVRVGDGGRRRGERRDGGARPARARASRWATAPRRRTCGCSGWSGIADPPRTEAIEAVAAAREAGIRTVMITGDHPVTAARDRARARHRAGGRGRRRSACTRAPRPRTSCAIVRDWKARGAVVAMTGDGVNDAPALREAHIGIAMGRTGTEVTREASDMVLADDNFASIVAAVREGRGIFDNIRKTLVYLLAGNTAELLVMLAAALVGLPLPLLPLQLLWINLVTDGLPALALVMDPPDADALAAAARARRRSRCSGAREWRSIVLHRRARGGRRAGRVRLGAARTAAWTRRATWRSPRWCSASCSARSPRAARRAVLGGRRVHQPAPGRRRGRVGAGVQLGLHQIPGLARLFQLPEMSFGDAGAAAAARLDSRDRRWSSRKLARRRR